MINTLEYNSSKGGSATGQYKPILVLLGVTIAAAFVGLVNLILDGNFAATMGLVLAVAFVVASIFKPSVSLYMLVFLGLAIEQLIQDYGWTSGFRYHHNLNNIFQGLIGVPVSPLEIHLLCIITGLILRFVLVKEKHVQVLAWKQLLLYMFSLVFFVLYGLFKGGEFIPALWEIRGIFYLVILMAIIPQIIRTEDQVRHMIWAVIAGMGFRAIEVTRHFAGADFSLIGSAGGWGNHEDSGLLATLVIFTIAMRSYKADRKQNIVLTILLPLMFIAIVASDRRTAYPVMAGAFIFFLVVQPPVVQKKIMSVVWKLGIVFAIYLGIFWNSTSTSMFIKPAVAIREGFAGDDKNEAADSYTSNLYRKVENYDLQRMITMQPLLGTGYGVKIDYFMPIPILWDMGFYSPHNQILGVMAKTGFVGFAIFVFFYLSAMAEIGQNFARIEDKYFRAVLVLAGAAVINHLVFSFFDIVLTYYRNNIYLGALLGTAASIIAISERRRLDAEVKLNTPQTVDSAPHHWLLLKQPDKTVVG